MPPSHEEVERRKGPDLWALSLRWLAVIGWLLMLGAFWIASQAKPQMGTFFERWSGVQMTRGWNLELARTILYLLFPGLLIGYGGLLVNFRRSRRHKDQVRLSLILLAVMSTIGTILCLIHFY